MSLLEKFGYKKDDFAIVLEQPDLFKSNAKTTKVVVGEKTTILGSINNIPVPATITVTNALWTRLTVRDHKIERPNEEPRISQVFGGVFSNFKADVMLQIDDTEMSLYDLMKQFITEAFGSAISDDKVNQQLSENLALNGLRNGGPFMFQQMGAGISGIQHAVEAFRSAGAVDDMRSVANSDSFNTAYKFVGDNSGMQVTSFELGTQNRKLSKTSQGFIDIVSAITENFERVVAHKKAAANLKIDLDSKIGKLSMQEITDKQGLIDLELNMAKDYVNCWSGAARQVKIVQGVKVYANKYNAVNAPCGRWTTASGDTTTDFDVWSNSSKVSENTEAEQIAKVQSASEVF